MRITYLGPAGSFTETALRSLPQAASADCRSCPTVLDAIDAVRSGDADGAVVPLENSVEGLVPDTLDALTNSKPLQIVAEVMLRVGFALMAKRGTAMDDIRLVSTHPHAHGQCRRWLAEHLPKAAFVAAPSTADAARATADAASADQAAIAGVGAAERYDLEILADEVGCRRDAVTRFVLLRSPGSRNGPSGSDRTSLVARIANRPGALRDAIGLFADRDINLTSVSSRPTGEALGSYFFWLDCEGHVDDCGVGDALSDLRRICTDVRFLGSYQRAKGLMRE